MSHKLFRATHFFICSNSLHHKGGVSLLTLGMVQANLALPSLTRSGEFWILDSEF